MTTTPAPAQDSLVTGAQQGFLKQRDHLITGPSLRALVAISKNRIFHSELRCLNFVNIEPRAGSWSFPIRELEEKQWRSIIRDSDDNATTLISEALVNLACPKVACVAVNKHEGCFGFKHMKAELAAACDEAQLIRGMWTEGSIGATTSILDKQPGEDPFWPSTDRPIYHLLCALDTAKILLQNLELHLQEDVKEGSLGLVPFSGSPSYPPQYLEGLSLCFHALTTLSLRIDVDFDWSLKEHYQTLKQALLRATSHEPSRAVSKSNDGPDYSSLAAFVPQSANIEVLDLRGYYLSRDELHAFLSRFTKTVKQLKMDTMQLEENEPWKDTVIWIAQNFGQLAGFEAKSPWQGFDRLEKAVKLTDKNTIVEDLLSFAGNASYSRQKYFHDDDIIGPVYA